MNHFDAPTRSSGWVRLTARIGAATLLGTALAGTVGVSVALTSPTHAWATDRDETVSVQIVDGEAPTPTPTTTTAPPATPSSTGVPSTGGTFLPTTTPGVTQQTITDPAAADAAMVDAETMAGLIYVSALRASSSPSILPDGGDVSLVVSIRNLSGETIDGAASFWLSAGFGLTVSDVIEVDVPALAPGETRTLTANLPGPGQWTLLQANATYTPPPTIDGVDVQAITRTENVLVAPWFTLSTASMAIAGVGGYLWWARQAARRAVMPV